MAGPKERRELVSKVSDLVNRRFGGQYRAAFDHYSQGRRDDGKIDADELRTLLEDANVGNMVTRGAWVRGVMEELDKDGDAKIAWHELESIIRAG